VRSRGGALVAAVVGVTLLAVLLLGRSSGDRPPLDPRSHEPGGTSALVALLRELDATVDIDADQPDGDTDVALVLRDRFDDEGREELEDWVRDGGVLVISDPDSPLTPLMGFGAGSASGLDTGESVVEYDAGECDIAPLEGLDTIAAYGWPSPGYEVEAGDESCFGDGESAHVVASDEGEGTIVALYGSGTLMNRTLDRVDNAPVAANLLAPREGTQVAVLDPTVPTGEGDGDEGLIDLMPDGVKRGLVQLAVAFLIYVAWRARRLGHPVDEPQPVKVAGSELVAAVGGLLERSKSPQHAADVLRAELRRDLVAHLGLPPELPPASFVQAVTARTDLDPAWVQAALTPYAVPDDQALLAVVRAIDQVRKEVLEHVGT
jgi:hypothetical protein